MKPRFLRRIAVLLLASLAFAQASVAFAVCPLERGMLSHTIAPQPNEPCAGCGTSATGYDSLYANRCLAHCTADLQLTGDAVAMVRRPGDAVMLLAPRADLRLRLRAGLDAPPPGAPPHRILLHSFLI